MVTRLFQHADEAAESVGRHEGRVGIRDGVAEHGVGAHARNFAGVGEDLWPQVIELAGRLAFDDGFIREALGLDGEIDVAVERGQGGLL